MMQASTHPSSPRLILPTPVRVVPAEGRLELGGPGGVEVAAPEHDAAPALRLLEPLRGIVPMRFQQADAQTLPGPDAYALEVAGGGATLRARSLAGFLNAAQSLRQLVPMEPALRPADVPAVRVEDAPRFSWRGLHVDVARHWFPIADLERLVDTMALLKLNRLHWHLTDDQGWRLEIDAWPRLVEVGGRRAESPRRGARTEGDGRPYDGHYTQADARHLVAYAAARGITVVPEIEMPGHAQAAIAAYPRLGHGAPPEVWTRWGISTRIFNVRDETLTALDAVLEEVAALFPGPYVHLGGDEVPTEEWAACPAAQARLAFEQLEDPRALQGWFLRRMAHTLRKLGKRAVGWDEILECGPPADAVVMAWRDAVHARTAARSGHDVVLCPMTHCYFDHYQGPPETEPEAIGGSTDWRDVLSFDPLAGGWSESERERLLGVQGNLWSEYIPDAAHLEYMAWPRGAALAEVAWSAPRQHDPVDFAGRWAHVAQHLDARGVAHRGIWP